MLLNKELIDLGDLVKTTLSPTTQESVQKNDLINKSQDEINISNEKELKNKKFKPIMILTFDNSSTLNFWDLSSGRIFSEIKGSSDNYLSLSVYNKKEDNFFAKINQNSVNLNNILACTGTIADGNGNIIEIWDITTKACLYKIQNHHIEWIRSIILGKFVENNKEFAGIITAGDDRTLKITDLDTKQIRFETADHFVSTSWACGIWEIDRNPNENQLKISNSKPIPQINKRRNFAILSSGFKNGLYSVHIWN